MNRIIAFEILVSVLLSMPGVVAAQDDGTAGPTAASVDLSLDPTTLADEVQGYYEGERISTYIVGSLGVAAIAAGIPMVIVENDFTRGMGWPLIILGALQGIGALVYAFQVGDQMEHYGNSLDADPGAFRDEETTHMAGTIDRFVFYQITELVLTLGGAGVATYGFIAGEDIVAGVGMGVGVLALPFLIIDLVNQQRGAVYADHVRRMNVPAPPPPSLEPDDGRADPLAMSAPATDGFYLSFSRAF